jgi:hypothetical protein
MSPSSGAITQQPLALSMSSIAATSSQHRTPPLKRLGLYGTPLKRLSLYERSMQQRADHARNIKSMEALQMATFCTFTPKTNTIKDNANDSNRTATTKATASTSGGSKSESVFDRLYKGANGSVASSQRSPPATTTTRWSNGSRQLLHQYSSSESRTSTAVSSRMEDLYEKEVYKARRRPKTDQQERRLRDRLCEERELQECTFRPKLKWGSKKSSQKSVLPVPNQAAPRKQLQVLSTPPAKLKHPRFPKEIIVIPPPPHDTKHRPWHTPRRREKISDFMTVSPLRDPYVVDEDESSRWITPSINTGSVVASGSVALTLAGTEYGSI